MSDDLATRLGRGLGDRGGRFFSVVASVFWAWVAVIAGLENTIVGWALVALAIPGLGVSLFWVWLEWIRWRKPN